MQNDAEVLVSKDEVLQNFHLAYDRGEPLILSPEDMQVSLVCYVAGIDGEYILINNPIPHVMLPFMIKAKSFILYCRGFWVKIEKLQPKGQLLVFPLENFGVQGFSRNYQRRTFTDKEDARVLIKHPFDVQTILVRRIFDLSQGGLSFRSRVKTCFIQRNRILPELEVYINDTMLEKHSGKVIYVKQIIDKLGQSFFQVGIQFTDVLENQQDFSNIAHLENT